jgi:hypothetical protein
MLPYFLCIYVKGINHMTKFTTLAEATAYVDACKAARKARRAGEDVVVPSQIFESGWIVSISGINDLEALQNVAQRAYYRVKEVLGADHPKTQYLYGYWVGVIALLEIENPPE